MIWLDPKYYVRRTECWGGFYVWHVVERATRKAVSHRFKSERAALRHCHRMEADRARYDGAMWDAQYARERESGTLPAQPGSIR